MGSQHNHLKALLIGNNPQTTTSNSVVFDDILVKRIGAFKPFIDTFHNLSSSLGNGIEENKGASSPFMILFIAVVVLCVILVFGIIYLFKKKRALERELDALIHVQFMSLFIKSNSLSSEEQLMNLKMRRLVYESQDTDDSGNVP